MSDVGLRGRRENRLRQPIRLDQTSWKSHAGYRARRPVALQAEPGQIATRYALNRHHVEPPATNGPALPLRRDILTQYVIRHEFGHLPEPPQGQLGQDRTLVRDGRRQHHVVHRHPIRGNQNQVIPVGVHVANLALANQFHTQGSSTWRTITTLPRGSPRSRSANTKDPNVTPVEGGRPGPSRDPVG